MSTTKTFPTTAVLTLATGTVMGEFRDAHELIEFLASGTVWTHQIPALHDEIEGAGRAILGEHFEPFDREAEGWEAYRDRMVEKVGPTIDVVQPEKPFHRADAGLADAIEIMGADRVAVVTP